MRTRDEDLEAPENLGAPRQAYLSPRARRALDRNWRGMGGDSGRSVLLSLVAGVAFIAALVIAGSLLR